METNDNLNIDIENEPTIGADVKVVNKEELLKIFRIGSMSKQEHKMIEFIEEFLREEKIEYTKDSMGNIYNLNYPGSPMICAHTDTVQDETDAFGAKFAKIYDDKIIRSYGVLGGDDKCGIYICMEILRTFKDINFCFCVQEEIGLLGSKFVAEQNKEKLEKIAYGLIFDRKGNSDIICCQNDYGTKEFENDLKNVGSFYQYKPERGLCSDTNTFKQFFSCCNISCGYYNPHSKDEYVDIEDLENALNFGIDIIYNLYDSYEPYKYEPKNYPARTFYGSSRSFGYNEWDDYDDYGTYYGPKYNKNGSGSNDIDYNPKKTKEEEKEKTKKKTSYTMCDCCTKYGDTIELKSLDLVICKTCVKKLFREIIKIMFGDN